MRHIGNCLKADPAYGKGVADALGIPLGELPEEAESRPRTEAQM
jgi:catalase